jgi:signal transduction histidine kinase
VFEARGEVRLRADIEAEMFRIVQEAVSNALRHASASMIRVSVAATPARVTLVVEDDGVGLTRNRARSAGGGVGLDAMQERAELIGGSLTVGEQAGGGTRVTFEYEVEGKE